MLVKRTLQMVAHNLVSRSHIHHHHTQKYVILLSLVINWNLVQLISINYGRFFLTKLLLFHVSAWCCKCCSWQSLCWGPGTSERVNVLFNQCVCCSQIGPRWGDWGQELLHSFKYMFKSWVCTPWDVNNIITWFVLCQQHLQPSIMTSSIPIMVVPLGPCWIISRQ